MNTVVRYLRADEWLSSKVVMMLGVCACFAFRALSDCVIALGVIVAFFVFCACFLSVSYVLNDFFDREVDRLAGKRKTIAGMPTVAVAASIVLLVVVGCAPVLLLTQNRLVCIVVVGAVYALGAAYSMPPARFKERGAVGLLECAIAQRCMPLLLLPCLLGFDIYLEPAFWFWMFLSFLDGLRYILIHQLVDQENDRISGVTTYVGKASRPVRPLVASATLIELVICFVLTLPLARLQPFVVMLGFGCTVILEWCIYRVLHTYGGKDWLATFDSVPLEAYLSFVYPFMVGVVRAIFEWGTSGIGWDGVLFAATVLILSARPMKVKLDLAAIYIRSKRAGHLGGEKSNE